MMFINFIKVGFRHLRLEPLYGSLNIIGLSISLTGIILLSIFIVSETSFDKFQKNYDRIYRLTTLFKQQGQENKFALNEGLWDDILVHEVTGVDYSTAFLPTEATFTFNVNGQAFEEGSGLLSDEDFLKVFGFNVLSGNRDFSDPNGIILTRKLALKFFGTEDAVGRIIEFKPVEKPIVLKVTAVVEDIPINSSIQFGYVLSGKISGEWWKGQFSRKERTGKTLHIYFRTKQRQDLDVLQSNIDRAFSKYKGESSSYLSPVQELAQIHFGSNNQFELQPGGNIDYLKIFILIITGFGLITIVNSLNINSYQFLRRLKEVGVRKLLGINKYRLISQFVVESIAITLLASIISIVIAHLVLLNVDLSLFSINTSILNSPFNLGTVFLLSIFFGVASAIYPAIRITEPPISQALKGSTTQKRGNHFSLRNVIVLVQIIGAATLFAFSLVVFRQIDYLNNKPLGYNKNNLIVFQRPGAVSVERWKYFKEKLSTFSVFESVGGNTFPLLGFGSMSTIQMTGSNGHKLLAVWNLIDSKFIETMKMELTEGRNISEQRESDSNAIIINETAKKELGLEGTLGLKLKCWRGEFEIIGVVNDFHFRPFNSKISPLVLMVDRNPTSYAIARYQPGEHAQAIEIARNTWKGISETSLEYHFFDDVFNKMLENEHQTSIVVTFFTALSLCITAIGLVGLIGYVAAELKKEIAIRKIVGSSVTEILQLIGSRFFVLTLSGLCIGTPVIIFLSDSWLSGFEYKTELTANDILVTFLSITFLTAIVIARQALDSGLESPIKVIRNE